MNFAAWFPRIAAIVTSFVVAKAASMGVTLDPETLTALMLLLYAGTHRLISKSVNPGDAVKTVIVDQEKSTVETSEYKTPDR